MAQDYYFDPRKRVRTERDSLVASRDRASARVERWAEVVGTLRGKVEDATFKQITSGWKTRWEKELKRTSRYLDKAKRDEKMFEAALQEGDGRGKQWRYRISFSYVESKKGRDRLMLDVLMRKRKGERASGTEARRAFYDYLRHGDLHEGWMIEQVEWKHQVTRQNAKGHSQTKESPVRSVSDQVAVDDHLRVIFRKVMGDDTEDSLEEQSLDSLAPPKPKKRKKKTGRPRGQRGPDGWHLILGEEEEDE